MVVINVKFAFEANPKSLPKLHKNNVHEFRVYALPQHMPKGIFHYYHLKHVQYKPINVESKNKSTQFQNINLTISCNI